MSETKPQPPNPGGDKAPSKPPGHEKYVEGLESVYKALWGISPPPGYIDRIAASHMNIFEFEAHERAKPAFHLSPRYQEDQAGVMADLRSPLGGQ